MTNPPRAGRCLAVLIAAWALAAANLVGEAGAEEIDRPTFTIDVPDSWVEDISMATDWFVWLDRSGDFRAECLIDVRLDDLPPTEEAQADWDKFLASEDDPIIIAQFAVGSGETVVETRRRRIAGNELVVVVSETESDRIVAAYFFSLLLPARIHIIRCETAAASYAALEAEFAAIIDSLEVKP